MSKKAKIIDTIVIALLLIFVLAMGLAYAENGASLESSTQAKLDKIEAKLATGAAKPKLNLKPKKARHVVGVVNSINDTIILLNTSTGLKTIFTDSSTKFISLGASPGTVTCGYICRQISLSELKAGDRVSAYGVDRDDAAGLAALVARLSTTVATRHALFGRISAINGAILVINHIVAVDQVLGTVNTTGETVIKSKDQTISFSQLKVGDAIAVSGTIADKGVLTAKLIHLIPGLNKTNPVATSSATP